MQRAKQQQQQHARASKDDFAESIEGASKKEVLVIPKGLNVAVTASSRRMVYMMH